MRVTISELENKIKAYKELCKLAQVPKLLIDFPELIQSNDLTEEEFNKVKKIVEEYRQKDKDLPF